MKLRYGSRAMAVAAFALVATPLLATTTAPAEQVRIRVAGLHELGAAFKAVFDGLRTPEPQTILIQQSARTIRNAARAMPGWFPVGSGPQPNLKTSAKAEIWTKPAEFRAVQQAFIAQAEIFATAANGADVAAIKLQAGKLGGTCKGCHDSFRQPKT